MKTAVYDSIILELSYMLKAITDSVMKNLSLGRLQQYNQLVEVIQERNIR